MSQVSQVTVILNAVDQGDPHAAEKLLPLVYEELRSLAAHKLAQEKPGQTLQATALVHEAYLRLVGVDQTLHWNSRGHFFAAAAEAIRRIMEAAYSAALRGRFGVRGLYHAPLIGVQRCYPGNHHPCATGARARKSFLALPAVFRLFPGWRIRFATGTA